MSEPIKDDPEIEALYAAYERKFRDWPSPFGQPAGADMIKLIKEALKTGKPITAQIPSDADA